jgi:preprotein translocase SecE subunit
MSNPPGPLEHAGDVDEFDAALVRGAGGVPVEERPSEDAGDGSSGNGAAEAAERKRAAVEAAAVSAGTDSESAALEAFGEGAPAEVAAPRRPSQPIHVRAIAFLRASWAELQRVQWPDRPHVTQATTVVLGFLVVAGVYLGVADWVASKIVNLIL